MFNRGASAPGAEYGEGIESGACVSGLLRRSKRSCWSVARSLSVLIATIRGSVGYRFNRKMNKAGQGDKTWETARVSGAADVAAHAPFPFVARVPGRVRDAYALDNLGQHTATHPNPQPHPPFTTTPTPGLVRRRAAACVVGRRRPQPRRAVRDRGAGGGACAGGACGGGAGRGGCPCGGCPPGGDEEARAPAPQLQTGAPPLAAWHDQRSDLGRLVVLCGSSAQPYTSLSAAAKAAPA